MKPAALFRFPGPLAPEAERPIDRLRRSGQTHGILLSRREQALGLSHDRRGEPRALGAGEAREPQDPVLLGHRRRDTRPGQALGGAQNREQVRELVKRRTRGRVRWWGGGSEQVQRFSFCHRGGFGRLSSV